MDQILAAAQNGMEVQSFLLNAVADNLANLNTPGYGLRITAATGGGGTQVRPPGVVLMGTALKPGASVPAPVVQGVAVPSFSTGTTQASGATMLAIQGVGFFQVLLPTGQVAYTRAGDFTVDASGQLVNPQGFRLVPPVTLPPGTQDVTVEPDGTVTGVVNGATVTLGQITVALFANGAGLVESAGGVYLPSANSGPPVVATPGTKGAGTILSNALNQSGVQVSAEMVKIIQASTAYALSAKLMAMGQVLDQATAQM
jgi:flagellar basal-body rod protein FlgG